MAVRIRMKRMGRTHRPFYRICVMDARRPRDGAAIEEVGTYDPMKTEKSDRVTLKIDRVEHWLSVGAQPTEKVAVLIRKFKENDWGTAKTPPPTAAPQVKQAPAAEEASADAPAEEGAEAAESTEG
ncbi:30S ribosomal protein S16 [Thalassoglobus sp. JC818]|uniref:30S ribosomal protein S16 n=1 Tax=Thalassoglobus sp. JC818 TaxID=3232136 RepID=UPI0034599139